MAINHVYNCKTDSFRDSQEFARRRLCRESMRKAKLTPKQERVALHLLNVWFNCKAKGEMQKTREQIAKSSRCRVWTVSATLKILRESNILVVLGCSNGGRGGATRYRMDTEALLALYGCKIPETIEGNLVPLSAYREASNWEREEPGFTHDTFDKFTHEPLVNFPHETSVNFTHEIPSRVYGMRACAARAHLSDYRSDHSQAESAEDDHKAQSQPQAVESPYQEIEIIHTAESKRIVLSLDGECQSFDPDGMSECEGQASQQPDQSLDGSSAAAAYLRGVRLEARCRKLEDAELQRVRFAAADVWSEYAGTDDVTDPRAWA